MPRKHPYILSADLPRAMAVQVRTIAKANRVSVSEIIRHALREWLETLRRSHATDERGMR